MRSAACEAWAQALEAQAAKEPAENNREIIIRQSLAAQLPAALPVVDDGLAAWARGPEAFALFKARATPAAELPSDPVAAAWALVGRLATLLDTLPLPARAPIAAKMLTGLSSIAKIESGRPRIETPDEVTRRLVEVRDAAVARAGILTAEEQAEEDRAVAELLAWHGGLGLPAVTAELERRLGIVLGGEA